MGSLRPHGGTLRLRLRAPCVVRVHVCVRVHDLPLLLWVLRVHAGAVHGGTPAAPARACAA